ncbi:hypothetical protein GGR57DRAFT_201399 [Xylariaceae sp. FL1272]|nr:hypothetical protein GGR57DRAFT_201399 [Xylariaceae sp. FL1272]
MSTQPDPYKILGVSKDAQLAEIRCAHRKLVLKCHPDKVQDPKLKEEKQNEFQQVQQAYETLSNDKLREDYDRQARIFAELARERERGPRTSATRAPSSTRTPRRAETSYYDVNIKTASPRANTFAAKGSPYTMRDPPRSYEDNSSGARLYEELGRHARKTASYEKERPSRKDEERRRRKEEDDRLEKERLKEKDAKKAEKAEKRLKEEREKLKELEKEKARREKEEKKKAEKERELREREREKQRKRDAVEKERSRRHAVAAESSSEESDSDEDDVIFEPHPQKSERQKSSSSRLAEDIEPPVAGAARERKMSGNMEAAVRYLARSGGKAPSLTRAQTLQEESFSKYMAPVAAPTPPPALQSAFAPPPVAEVPTDTSDSDVARRSSARANPRRPSHDTPKSSGGKSSHKKSSSRDDPVIVNGPSRPPSFQKSHSERHPPHRSNTESFNRAAPMPVPSFHRADTWYAHTDRERERERERNERSRSRPNKYADDTESEDDRERRHRRSTRRTTHSPEPMPTQYKYTVEGGKATRQKSYHAPQEPPARSYKSAKGNAYITPNSSSSRAQRAYKSYDKSYARDAYDDDQPQYFSKVKYASQFSEGDISYSKVPYSGSYRSQDIYAS